MSAKSFRRSAIYMNKLTTIANIKAHLNIVKRSEKVTDKFEERRLSDIEIVYNYIERSANVGAVRIFDSYWSDRNENTYARDLIFRDKEIKAFLIANGFHYSSSYKDECIEWYQATSKDELK